MGNSQCCTAERSSNGIQQNQPLSDETVLKHANRLDFLQSSPEILRAQTVLTVRDYEFLYSTLFDNKNTDIDVLACSELYQMLVLQFSTSAYSVPQCLGLDILTLFPIVSDSMHHVIVDKYRDIYGRLEDIVNVDDFQNHDDLESTSFTEFGDAKKVPKGLIANMQMQEFRWGALNGEGKEASFQVLAEAACAQYVAEHNLRVLYRAERAMKKEYVPPVKSKPAPLSIPDNIAEHDILSPIVVDNGEVLSEELGIDGGSMNFSSMYSESAADLNARKIGTTMNNNITSPLTALALDDSDDEIKLDNSGAQSVDRRQTAGRYRFVSRDSPRSGRGDGRGDSPPPRTRSPSAKGMDRGKWFDTVKEGVLSVVRIAADIVTVKRLAPPNPVSLDDKVRAELLRDWSSSNTYSDLFQLLQSGADRLLAAKNGSAIKAALIKRPSEFPPGLLRAVLLETLLPSAPDHSPMLGYRSEALHLQVVSTMRRLIAAAGQLFCKHASSCAVHTRTSASRPASPTSDSDKLRRLPVNCVVFTQELESCARKALKQVFMLQLEYAVGQHTFPLYNELLLSSQLICVAPSVYSPPIVVTTNAAPVPPPLFPQTDRATSISTPRGLPVNITSAMLKWSDWRAIPEVLSHMRITTATNLAASANAARNYRETGNTRLDGAFIPTSGNNNSNNLKLLYMVEREFTHAITIVLSPSAPEYIRTMMVQTNKKEPFHPMSSHKTPTAWGVLWLLTPEPFSPADQPNPPYVPSFQVQYSRSPHFTVLNRGDCFSQADVADGRVWLLPRDCSVCSQTGASQPASSRHDALDMCSCSHLRLTVATDDGPIQLVSGVLSGRKGGLDMSLLEPFEDPTLMLQYDLKHRRPSAREAVVHDQLMYSIQCLDGRSLEHQVLEATVVYKF